MCTECICRYSVYAGLMRTVYIRHILPGRVRGVYDVYIICVHIVYNVYIKCLHVFVLFKPYTCIYDNDGG